MEFDEKRVREIIAEELNLEVDEITDDLSLKDEVESADVEMWDLLSPLEWEYDIYIDDEDAEKLTTVSSLMQYLREYKEEEEEEEEETEEEE